MTFDLIITTYNRPESVLRLVKEAQSCHPAPDQVIVVDSADDPNVALQIMPGVLYVRSSHKNQPYQRLLGAFASDADVILFLDDDLEIMTNDLFATLLVEYKSDAVVGATLDINYQSATGNRMDEAVMYPNPLLSSFLFTFTGVSLPSPGKMGRLGIVGKKPTQKMNIEFFHGPCMSFKRKIIKSIIPYDLISQAEIKLSMGEDKVISSLSTQYGQLVYIPIICLNHPPNDSTYFQNIRSFTGKVIYSRLYLSRIYARVFNKPWWKEVLMYYWFTFWRIFIAFISLIIRPSQSRKEKFFGTLDGLWLALTLPQKAERLTPDIDWESEIKKDLISTKHASNRSS